MDTNTKDNSGLAEFQTAIRNVASNEGAKTGLELAVIVAVHNMGSYIDLDRLMNGTKSSTGKTKTANACQTEWLRENDPLYKSFVDAKTVVKPANADSAKTSAWLEGMSEAKAKCSAIEKMFKRVLPIAQYLRDIEATDVSRENKGKTLVFTGRDLDPATLAPLDKTGTVHAILANVRNVAGNYLAAKARGFKAPASAPATTTTTTTPQQAPGTGAPQEQRTAIDTASALHDIFKSPATTKATLAALAASPALDLVIVDGLKAKFTVKRDTGTVLDLAALATWLTTTMKTALDLPVFGNVVPPSELVKAPAKAADAKAPVKRGKAA